MRLAQVIPAAVADAADVEITSLAYDTRTVTPGTLFFCVPGFTRDGHDFAQEAIAKGAAALVVERALDSGVPEIRVDSVRQAMAPAAARFYGDPTQALQTVGITGTNGKTTTAFLIRALLEADNRQTGLLGTVTSIIGGEHAGVQRTTPEAIDLQRTFRQMVDKGDTAAVVEVSSHALELHRADSIHFDVAVFTNLTQDHLDFHGSMEQYFQAKRRLFKELRPRHSIVNVDDAYGRRLAEELDDPTTFGITSDALYRARSIETGLTGSTFELAAPEGIVEVTSALRGTFNIYNLLAAYATARTLKVPAEVARGAMGTAGQVPGRFETVDEGQPFGVIVDYAHTPDSLENVLAAALGLTENGLHVVFGCGGDRDRGKRPLMGEIASRLADRVIITSDNPRSEDPESIIAQILAGTSGDAECETDRRKAIERTIAAAQPGDVVLIAGKGHEQGQEFAEGRKVPFDDVTVAREALRGLAHSRGALRQ